MLLCLPINQSSYDCFAFGLMYFKAANGGGGVCEGRWWMPEKKDNCRGSLGLHLHPAP